MAVTGNEDHPLDRYRDLVDEYEAFRAACRRPLPSVVRVNRLVAETDDVVTAYRAAGIGVERIDWQPALLVLDTDSPGTTWPYVQGWVHGQEAVSTLPVTVLDPDPGAVVLDLCGAPGSKTTQLAAHQGDRGTIVANDVDLGRLSALRSNCDRLGVTSTVVTNRDGRHFDATALGIEAFDSVLVDAPCSCEGTVRKNPDTFDDWSVEYIDSVSTVQSALLANAIDQTRVGGRVVYSTCTFAPEENEAVVDDVLESRDCRVVDTTVPVTHTSGVTEWRGDEYDPMVADTVRVYPHHNDTGGFYLAVLEVTG